jgi:hypothetical protein
VVSVLMIVHNSLLSRGLRTTYVVHMYIHTIRYIHLTWKVTWNMTYDWIMEMGEIHMISSASHLLHKKPRALTPPSTFSLCMYVLMYANAEWK